MRKGIKDRERVEMRARRYHLERFVLQSLTAGVILITALVAPNVVGALKKLDRRWLEKRDPRRRIREALYRLEKRGLIVVRGEGGSKRVEISATGQSFLDALLESRVRVRKPLRWDGRWRIVFFDIEEKYRRSRNAVRRALLSLGLYRLQDSVWVHPYDCEEAVALIRTKHHVGRRLLYVVADALEGDEPLRRHFGLR